jgi:hypothetical protein
MIEKRKENFPSKHICCICEAYGECDNCRVISEIKEDIIKIIDDAFEYGYNRAIGDTPMFIQTRMTKEQYIDSKLKELFE